ncbi:SAM-dependent methyltransferase [Actinomadura parmotrematis]|uniref:SAM-dependent methyltransferase n=1 Tax=Actinomadura parmotrematis TaxID=2864039 RepID=A0ABS7FNZ6_9ACTN|nr:SAM-dependent methyltransferase [Actinomadura parmotrematis]MBW8481960.1 SAM-dependent methyltransferase [Actinomadura parmotrematis]
MDLRTDVPHPARVYDFLLGGKDNFEADRAAAAEVLKHQPNSPRAMRSNRAFLARMARHVVREHGIRQFLDVGTGLPTSPNLHEAAQEIAPETRVLYVDNDPIVLVHARALLTSAPEGATAYLDADLRDPASILGSAKLRETLDLSRPVALTLLAVLHFVTDEDEAHAIVRALLEPLAPGSVLAISVVPDADETDPTVAAGAKAYRAQGLQLKTRTKAEVERFFDGLDLLGPGVTRTEHWYPDHDVDLTDLQYMYAGVAVKR